MSSSLRSDVDVAMLHCALVEEQPHEVLGIGAAQSGCWPDQCSAKRIHPDMYVRAGHPGHATGKEK